MTLTESTTTTAPQQTGFNPYDAVPYPSLSYSRSHPTNLATIATLFGMQPAPVDHCRLLELGCASGGNLLPMASTLPGSQFLGIDYGETHIETARKAVSDLALSNITFDCLNFLAIEPQIGKFDYIVAHGIYSWVPTEVQEKIMQLCGQLLTPNGIAYISYNTYPGYHMRNILRDTMQFHTREISDPLARAAEGKKWLQFLADNVPESNQVYSNLLKQYAGFLSGEHESISGRHDAFFIHDELEEDNNPVYFSQFAEHADRHGLQYLGEADVATMVDRNLPPQVSDTLVSYSKSAIELEQYMDFYSNRPFRETILCRQEVTLTRKIEPHIMQSLYIGSPAIPETSQFEIDSTDRVNFRCHNGALFTSDHPLTKAAMLVLNENWPRMMSFKELVTESRTRLHNSQPVSPQEPQILAANLIRAYTYSQKLVSLRVHAPALQSTVSDTPEAYLLARYQAMTTEVITNLYHERVRLDNFNHFLIRLLDGSRQLPQLVEIFLEGPIADGFLKIKEKEEDDSVISDPDRLRELLSETIHNNLVGFSRSALLIS